MFFNRREVKRARKNYECAFCGKPITGAHVRFWVIDGQIGIDWRSHRECEKQSKEDADEDEQAFGKSDQFRNEGACP